MARRRSISSYASEVEELTKKIQDLEQKNEDLQGTLDDINDVINPPDDGPDDVLSELGQKMDKILAKLEVT
jgi:prefoldin subunit 5